MVWHAIAWNEHIVHLTATEHADTTIHWTPDGTFLLTLSTTDPHEPGLSVS